MGLMNKIEAICRNVEQWLQQIASPPSTTPPPVPAQMKTFPRARRLAPPIIVRRDSRPYWEERRWQRNGQEYSGNFQTRFGSWQGFINVSPGGRVEVFIHNPPTVLQRHPHWQCFQQRDNGWFFIHPTKSVPDVCAGILGVEKTIIEAFTL